jgi:hypothetical protein
MAIVVLRIIAIIALFVLQACDPARPFLLRNGLSTPIGTHVKFEGGPPLEVTLRPGQVLRFVRIKGDVELVEVKSTDGRVYVLDSEKLEGMKTSIGNLRSMIWNVQNDGITPLSRSDLNDFERN